MNSKKQTVLVADDDPRLLKLIQRNLEIANYRVVTVSDGPSVLRQAESEEPDLYVLDIMMPGLDGREVTRRLREFSIAPVLMLTAKDTEDDKVAGLEAGADDYLTKPFGAPELIARVKALMRRRRGVFEASVVIAFVGVLVVGFALHNITEGFGIAAPMTMDPNPAPWRFLGLAGLIGGGPTFIGTWIGYLASSDYFYVAFLAVAAGALLYVVNELFHVGRRLSTPTSFAWGLLLGFLVAYATDLVLTLASA